MRIGAHINALIDTHTQHVKVTLCHQIVYPYAGGRLASFATTVTPTHSVPITPTGQQQQQQVEPVEPTQSVVKPVETPAESVKQPVEPVAAATPTESVESHVPPQTEMESVPLDFSGAPEVVQKIKSPVFVRGPLSEEEQRNEQRKLKKQQRMGLLFMMFGASLMLISGYYFTVISADPIMKTQGILLLENSPQVEQMVAEGKQLEREREHKQLEPLQREYERLNAKLEKDVETRRKYAPKD